MAGLGFGGTGKRGAGCSRALGTGIQFVKSSVDVKKEILEDGYEDVKREIEEDGSTISNADDQYENANGRCHEGIKTNSSPVPFGAPAKVSSGGGRRDSPMKGFVRASEESGKPFNTDSSRFAWRDPSKPVDLSKGSSVPQAFARIPAAQPILTAREYHQKWQSEKDASLVKLRKLAWEVVSLKSNRPNAIDKLHSAANRVPVRVEFNTEPVFAGRGHSSFMCHVFIEGISVGSGQGLKIKDAKVNGYETALQKILMPELRVVQLDPVSKELQGSMKPFTSPPPQPSNTVLPKSLAQLPPSIGGANASNSSVKNMASHHKESNLEAAAVKRRIDEQRPLEDFVIVEPLVPIPDCTPTHTLRRSADFNHMLLEYEYFFQGEAARCILRIEGQVLADVNGATKLAAKNKAAEQGLCKLKKICWVIKTKQAVDSDTKISKEEMLNELTDQSDLLNDDNVGNKLLRKMGWSGGGVGKDGSGMAEPVSQHLKSVLNREGLGLSAAKGITDEYRTKVKEIIENYAASENQEDLVFNCDFRLEERLIIHDHCRRLNLRSKCKGKGSNRYLCVRRKRSANMLFHHIMSCGGETIRYKLVPPQGERGKSFLGPSNNRANERLDTRHCPPFQQTSLSSLGNDPSSRSCQNDLDGKETEHKKLTFQSSPPYSVTSNVKFDDKKFGQPALDISAKVCQDVKQCHDVDSKDWIKKSPSPGLNPSGFADIKNSPRNGPLMQQQGRSSMNDPRMVGPHSISSTNGLNSQPREAAGNFSTMQASSSCTNMGPRGVHNNMRMPGNNSYMPNHGTNMQRTPNMFANRQFASPRANMQWQQFGSNSVPNWGQMARQSGGNMNGGYPRFNNGGNFNYNQGNWQAFGRRDNFRW
ncbi:NF-kappa-b-repressing factor [Plakobranchus ocellatus]|uniref:NF-kappa-b-repressing factor n=1 Tax=Plakobranchus ocellatus TaxID=259542 RepID=A0AAV3XRM1_9GAST|nr:NF-kappa-b-repressing factor [Plakobranchus ocellatus]